MLAGTGLEELRAHGGACGFGKFSAFEVRRVSSGVYSSDGVQGLVAMVWPLFYSWGTLGAGRLLLVEPLPCHSRHRYRARCADDFLNARTARYEGIRCSRSKSKPAWSILATVRTQKPIAPPVNCRLQSSAFSGVRSKRMRRHQFPFAQKRRARCCRRYAGQVCTVSMLDNVKVATGWDDFGCGKRRDVCIGGAACR